MKYTWIVEHLEPKTGTIYWTLHHGSRWFGKLFIFGILEDGVTKDESVMKKWKEYYKASVYKDSRKIN